LEIVSPSPGIAAQTAKSIAPIVAAKRAMFNNAPLCKVSLYAFLNDEMDVVFSLELAVLPVTKDPFGLLLNRWNRTMAYKWAVHTTG
jgi:hypothetical protein